MDSQPDTFSSPPHETSSTASANGVVESLADAIDSVLTVSEVEGYRYETLDKSTQEIRLLLLQPSKDPTEPIELSIFNVPLQNANPYWALSYTWGDASFREEVQLNRLKFSVTRNLYEALKSLQSRLSGELRLWVDAVCINQDDLDERSQQVKMMCHIYAQADVVAAFMGLLGDGVLLGFQLITVLAKVSREAWPDKALPIPAGLCVWLCNILQDEDYTSAWAAVSSLFSREWWSRAWTVQEVAVSDDALFICGNSIMDFDDVFAVGVFLRRYKTQLDSGFGNVFDEESKRQSESFNRHRGLAHGVSNVALLSTEHANQKLRKVLQTLPPTHHAQAIQVFENELRLPKPSLSSVMRRFRSKRCTEPRDAIQ